jgi:hypothetical protein
MTTNTSPFSLDNSDAYAAWREQKLAAHPQTLDQLIVEIKDPARLSETEHAAIVDCCRRANMAIYVSHADDDADKNIIQNLGKQLGLQHLDHNKGADEDAITALTVQHDAYHKGYIPYTNRAIAWHTDGYYNPLDRQINALLLHCVQAAAEGGENELLDHEIAYLLLRDQNPEYIRALMHPEAMTIPANVSNGEITRAEQTGPVFSIGAQGQLHMRYTDRSRSILWRDDPSTQEAVSALKQLLHTPGQWHFKGKLAAGQGLISNNVLHTRTAFNDGDNARLLYRARYYERIRHT